MLPLIITGAVIASVLALFGGIFLLIGPDQDVEGRLDSGQFYADSAGKGARGVFNQRMNEQLKRRQFGSRLSKQLNQAGVSLTPAEFIAINVGLVVVFLLLGFLLTRTFIAGIGVAALAGVAPRIWLHRQRSKRIATFQDQLPDVLSLIVGSLRGGYGLIQALKLVAQEMPSPSAEEYNRVVDEIAVGFSMQQALNHLVERMESDDLMMVVTAINIQSEVGGNLSTILDTITHTIRERVELQGEVRAMTSMQRATGYMLAAMPFGVGAFLLFMNPEYIMQLFIFPWIGIPIAAMISMTMGLFLINRLMQMDI